MMGFGVAFDVVHQNLKLEAGIAEILR